MRGGSYLGLLALAGNHVDECRRQLNGLVACRPKQWWALADHFVEQFERSKQLIVIHLAVFRQVVTKVIVRIDLLRIVRSAEGQLQVSQLDVMVDNPVEQAFFIEEVSVTVVVGDWLALPQAPRHGCEFHSISLGLAGAAPAICLVDGVGRILRAVTVGRPTIAGHVLVLAPESAGGIDPADNGLDAGGFGGFVHHDFFFAHGDFLAAISRY